MTRELEAGVGGLSARVGAFAFLLLIAMGPLSLVLFDPVQVPAAQQAPAWSWKAFRAGDWTAGIDREARKSSQLTRYARGVHHEARALAGLPISPSVRQGRGGWLIRLDPTAASVREARTWRPVRVATIRQLRERAAAVSARIVAVPVPDKVRLYGDRLPAAEGIAAHYRPNYRELLEDLQAAGVLHVDVLERFRRAVAARPDVDPYLRGDTHWDTAGILIAAEATYGAVRDAALLPGGAPAAFTVLPFRAEPRIGDMARNLGMFPHGRRERQLLEPPSLFALADGATGLPIDHSVPQPDARVAVVGDSFAEAACLAFAGVFGRTTDTSGAKAATGPIRELEALIEDLESESRETRLIVWIFVENGWLVRRHWADYLPTAGR